MEKVLSGAVNTEPGSKSLPGSFYIPSDRPYLQSAFGSPSGKQTTSSKRPPSLRASREPPCRWAISRITDAEIAGLLACLGVIAAASLLLYGVYRLTLNRVCAALDIRAGNQALYALS